MATHEHPVSPTPRPRRIVLGLGATALVGLAWILFALRNGDGSTLPSVDSGPSPGAGAGPADAVTGSGDGMKRVGLDQLETDLYRALLEMARDDPPTFRTRVEELLSTTAEAGKHAAALRAWHDAGLSDPVPALAEALTHAESAPAVRALALELLQPRCSVDGRARDALIDYLRLGPEDAGQRGSAFAHVLRWAGADQVRLCVPLVHQEADPDVVLRAARALLASPTPGSRTAAEALHWRHPDARVRKRLRALGIGR